MQKERGRDQRESETIRSTPTPGGNQADKSNGNGDDALEIALVGGRTEADALNDAHKKATKATTEDGVLEDNPYEHG
jgi:hypothetical protein